MSDRNTLIDFFKDVVTERGEFLVYDDGLKRRSHTYVQVGCAARGFAARLLAHGIRKDDTVIFLAENRPEWIACYWGCLLVGAVAVPIDYRSSPDFIAKVRGLVNAKAAVVGDDVDAGLARLEADGTPCWPLAEFDWNANGPWPAVPISRDDVTQIIFTSGATAEPKGVVIRHRNVLANVVPVEREIRKYRKYARPFRPIRFLNLLPLSHMFGQSMATSVPPMLGGMVVFTKSFNPHDLIRLIRSRRISVVVCVPKMLDVLREHARHMWPESDDTGTWSIPARWWHFRRAHRAFGPKFWAFVVGAAPLGSDLEAFWRKLGFAVVQGYGLTETAPIVTLNHPFRTSAGSVGTPISGVDISIAEDGELLVRGENVTSGYFVAGQTAPAESPLDADGWLHTGDIGERDAQGRVFIKGRKKEMIVTPEGLNVFPEDVERVLNTLPGVSDSAVVGVTDQGAERVHAVVITSGQLNLAVVVREANSQLQDHQRVRTISVWPGTALPRTDGTRKLKRREVRDWITSGRVPTPIAHTDDSLEDLIARFTPGRNVTGATTLDELGLSSLDRVELMVALEDRFQTRIDEARFADTANVEGLKALLARSASGSEEEEPVVFPSWNRSWPVRLVRRLSLATWIIPLTHLFAHLRVDGLEHVRALTGPVIFASNHQSHMDVPVILAALPGSLRAQVAPAMAKEFFKAHFFPAGYSWRQRLTNSANYYLAAAFFNAFPIPQREAGTRQTLGYMGELTGRSYSVLIFPEGVRSNDETIGPFRGGIGLIGVKLDVPVIPVRVEGTNYVLPQNATMASPGHVRVAFGRPLHLRGENYPALAHEVEAAVRSL
jgi:long-chain acyl-CoA synthetase